MDEELQTTPSALALIVELSKIRGTLVSGPCNKDPIT